MPKVKVNNLTFNYDQQGSGEPLILIPYLAADHACYAFQVAEYAKHFTCISLDLRGTGESDGPGGAYTTEVLADDVAGFMQAIGVQKAHVAGLSLGGAVGMWLAAKYPVKVKTLSLHSSWPRTDAFVKMVVESWQMAAKAAPTIADMVITALFPWCFTPELYATRPEYIQALSNFVRSRPAQSLQSFLEQSNAVQAHDAEAQLGKIAAPTHITFGRDDVVTSTRFVDPLKSRIRNSELLIFEGCSHAGLYEKVEEFNQKTLDFLKRHSSEQAALRSTGTAW
jgi:pimeloyl-ACP methyl ester carboxylesterase